MILRQHISWKNPEAEVAGMVKLIARQLKADPELALGQVYVAVPNKQWKSAFEAALRGMRISCFSPKELLEMRAKDTQALVTVDFGGGVCLGSYGGIQKLSPEHLFCAGLVEGFYPVGTEDEATLAAEASVLRQAVTGEIPGTLIFSSFKRISPDEAQVLKLAGRRRREHGQDVVCVNHSPFIDELGDDAPALVSGEQFMMTHFG